MVTYFSVALDGRFFFRTNEFDYAPDAQRVRLELRARFPKEDGFSIFENTADRTVWTVQEISSAVSKIESTAKVP